MPPPVSGFVATQEPRFSRKHRGFVQWRILHERRTDDKGSIDSRADKTLVLSRTLLDTMSKMEGTEKFLVLGKEISGTCPAARLPRDECAMRIPIEDQDCCYYKCPEPGTIHIGKNGGDSHWICFRHLGAWREARARFLAYGLPCEMEELGELVCGEHFRRHGSPFTC